MTNVRFAMSAFFAAVFMTSLAAQIPYPPVPTEMESAFLTTTHAGRLSPEPQGQNLAYAYLRFSTTQKTVSLDWVWSVGGAPSRGEYDEQSVSYKPTAIGLHAGESSDFYVAGYDVRNGQVVVERWSVINMVFSQAPPPPGGGDPLLGFSYNIVRTPLLRTDSVSYVRALAYNHHADELLLFTEVFPHRVWRYSPEMETLNVLVDSTTLPGLGTYESVRTVKFLSGATEPGFAVLGLPWREWESASLLSAPATLLILRDEDLDGLFDETAEITWDDYDARGYYEFKDARYK